MERYVPDHELGRLRYFVRDITLKIIKNYDKQDCIHYKISQVPDCCGRSKSAGFCTIQDEDGYNRNKICSRQVSYCRYEKKEETPDVHP